MAFDFAAAPDIAPADQAHLDEVFANPGFGNHFTDHMVLATWTVEQGWHDAKLVGYSPLSLTRPARSSTTPRRSSRG